MGRVFRKAFRILGLGERKGRWAMEQDFHGDFQVNVMWFFASFSGVHDWIVLILVWFERSLHSTQVSEESCPWPLKLMTSKRVERTWIRTGGYGGSGANGLRGSGWRFPPATFIGNRRKIEPKEIPSTPFSAHPLTISYIHLLSTPNIVVL